MGMKLRYAVSGVAFGLVLSLPARQLPADTLALSLDQCITIALSENPTIKVADMEIERMDYSKKETLGQLLPTINFGANYNRMVAKQVAYMNMDFGSLGGGGDAGQGDGEEPENRLSGAK